MSEDLMGPTCERTICASVALFCRAGGFRAHVCEGILRPGHTQRREIEAAAMRRTEKSACAGEKSAPAWQRSAQDGV